MEPSGETERHLAALFEAGTLAGLTDGQLLERFATRRNSTAEAAFEELVRRHGPMVLRVCRASLRNEHDAHDAFQATFLILVHKARSLWVRDSLGPWLHQVALRVTSAAKASAARRRVHERRGAEMTARTLEAVVGDDRKATLHEELGRLSERDRAVVILCDLEGLTHEAAARQLAWPIGTVKSRQARARQRLKQRLIRRGLGPTTAGLALAALETPATAAVPSVLAESTVQAAMQLVLGQAAVTGLVASPVAALVKAGVQTMTLLRLKSVAVSIVSAAAVMATTSLAVVAYSGASPQDGPVAGRPNNETGVDKGQRKSEPPIAPAQTKASPKTPEEELYALLREFEESTERALKPLRDGKPLAYPKAKYDEYLAEWSRLEDRFLALASRNPHTNVAEQAIFFLAENGSAQRDKARAIVARDYARSDRLQSLLGSTLRQSKPTEDVLRAAIAESPYPNIRGLACYWLARFLVNQAEMIRTVPLCSPKRREWIKRRSLFTQEEFDRVTAKDPNRLEDEAATLYARVIKEFPHVANNAKGMGPTPFLLGEEAKIRLDARRTLAIGMRAPEIVGVDLDGKPMKLSEFRDKVVVLYVDPRGFPPPGLKLDPPPITIDFPALAKTYAGQPLALLGVVQAHRETFQKITQDTNGAARFWYDPGKDGQPGSILPSWDGPKTYVIDPKGFIRYSQVSGETLKTAVERTFKEFVAR
jgi:RNA polymerase sigma factor (sigma-70 family)